MCFSVFSSAVDFFVRFRRLVPRELFQDVQASVLAHLFGFFWVVQQKLDFSGQGVRAFGRHQKAVFAVLDDFRQAADFAADDGCAGGEAFGGDRIQSISIRWRNW